MQVGIIAACFMELECKEERKVKSSEEGRKVMSSEEGRKVKSPEEVTDYFVHTSIG